MWFARTQENSFLDGISKNFPFVPQMYFCSAEKWRGHGPTAPWLCGPRPPGCVGQGSLEVPKFNQCPLEKISTFELFCVYVSARILIFYLLLDINKPSIPGGPIMLGRDSLCPPPPEKFSLTMGLPCDRTIDLKLPKRNFRVLL